MKKQNSLEPNKCLSNFKEMPLLMKFLFIIGLISLISTLLNFIQLKPIGYSYFGSGFPENYPFVWYLFLLFLGIFNLVAFMTRSFSLLKKYILISIVMFLFSLPGSINYIVNLPVNLRVVSVAATTFSYVLGGLIYYYLYRQKKYFNNK